MNEEQLIQVLQALKNGVEHCANEIDALKADLEASKEALTEKTDVLEDALFNQIIRPANEYIEETNKNARFDEFNEKYGDRFAEFVEPLKAFEGDDYDIVRSAFDQYDDYEGEKTDVDTYVETLVEELHNKLQSLKKGLGIPEDTEIAVEETPEGETVVTTEDGEVVATSEDEKTEEEVIEGDEEPDTEEIIEEEAEDDPEEVAAFEEELEKYKD